MVNMGMLTTTQVAKEFSVTIDTVWAWIRAGRLRAFKTPGRQWRIPGSELERLQHEGVPVKKEGQDEIIADERPISDDVVDGGGDGGEPTA